MADDLTLDDFRKQLDQALQFGMKDLVLRFLGMECDIPEAAEPGLQRIGRMIDAMTPEERRDPARIDAQRRLRIALHSDTQPHEVQQFLRQFEQTRSLIRQMARMSIGDRLRLITGIRGFGPPSDDDDIEE